MTMAKPSHSMQGGLRSATVVDGRLELILNNRIAAIEEGRRPLVEFLAGQALGDVIRHRMEVVFEELVSNTIRHGFSMHSDQSIHIRVEPRPGLVEFTFEDDGAPFNPLEIRPSEPFKTIETAKIGGLGIPMVAKLSVYLRYERPQPHVNPTGFTPRNRLVLAIAT
ncbi:MAG TPA: ATP-binding protein [Rhizomicrobium sp.]|nr:ATP-binding protein [Rhizomicrobium sp.]